MVWGQVVRINLQWFEGQPAGTAVDLGKQCSLRLDWIYCGYVAFSA